MLSELVYAVSQATGNIGALEQKKLADWHLVYYSFGSQLSTSGSNLESGILKLKEEGPNFNRELEKVRNRRGGLVVLTGYKPL